ncbi:MAG: COX15/CtaA family protein [Polyangiales bacterium]
MPRRPNPPARTVGLYLLACAVGVAAMIVVGGLVRLTRSGLSIVEWNPVSGILPPLGEQAWLEELAHYRASPEGRLVNSGMDLAGFQRIFLVEWVHRLLGRVVGLLVLLPLVVPRLRRAMSGALFGKLALLVLFFAAQGLLGWLMVASGLVDVPHVSPYRLASHLLAAFAIFAALVHLGLDELGMAGEASPGLHRASLWLLGLVLSTVGFGGLVAGLHAGTLFATFPDYAGAVLPRGAFEGGPTSPVASPLGVLVMHRTLALLVLVASLVVSTRALRGRHDALRLPGLALAAGVLTQIGLGAATVFAHVPLPLASLHQANAIFVVASLVALAHASRARAQRSGESADALAAGSLPSKSPST